MVKELMQWLAPVVASDWTIGSVVLLLLFWALWYGTKLRGGTVRLAAALDRATRRVERSPDAAAFAADYEAVSADLAADPVLGARWEEFNDSLVRTRGFGDRVRSTSRCDHWFNLSLLRVGGIDVDPRLHAALPNLLVGVGLLFTFLGLAAALTSAGGVMAGDTLGRNTALRTLLDAASAKFITSLVGLGLSIAYALWRKKHLALVEKALDGFTTALEKRAPLLTPIELQQQANDLAGEQLTAAQGLANELSFAMAQALDRAFDQRLGEHIQPLTEVMQRLADGMSNQSKDAMERMTEAFLDKLQGGTGDRMQDVAASLERLSGGLDGLQSGLGEAAARMAQSAETMAARMGEGAEAALARITEQMGGLAGTLRAVADDARGAGADAGRELAERLTAAAAGFEASARAMTAAITGAAEDSRARMGQEAEQSAARLAGQVEAMVGELGRLANQSRTAGEETMQAVAARVSGASAGFEAAAGRVAEALERAASDTGGALGRGAEQAVERIAEATEGMRDEMRALIEEFKGAALGAGEALRASGAAGAEAVGASLNGAGEAVAAALAQASAKLAGAGEAAGASLQQGGEAAGTRLDQAGAGFAGRTEGLAQQVAALTTATNGIVLRLSEFAQAAGEAAQPLAASSADLRAASEAARSAVEPLGQAAQTVGRAAEQIAGAGQRLEGTQAAAGRLADSLTGAVGRFAGVDQDLAKVFEQLQVGLSGFQEAVAKTTKQTDDNLGRAAGQLGNAVMGLEKVLESLVDVVPPRPNGGAPAGNGAGRR